MQNARVAEPRTLRRIAHLACAAGLSLPICAGAASALPEAFLDTPCPRPAELRRCFGLGAEAGFVETGFGAPRLDLRVALRRPDGPEWRLVAVELRFDGSASYRFGYSSSGAFQSASLEALSFLDSDGVEMARTSRSLEPLCGPAAVGTGWECADGNSVQLSGAAFGAFGEFFPPQSPLPALRDFVTLRASWIVSGPGEPDLGNLLRVDGISFHYTFDVIPEPATALLTGLGIFTLALHRRERFGVRL